MDIHNILVLSTFDLTFNLLKIKSLINCSRLFNKLNTQLCIIRYLADA